MVWELNPQVPLTPKLKLLLRTMSPDQVVPVQENGWAVARAVLASGRMATRMSPKRASPSGAPTVPSGAPPSATAVTLTLLPCLAQVWTALITAPCQENGAWGLSFWNRTLGDPPTSVPSGAKLRV